LDKVTTKQISTSGKQANKQVKSCMAWSRVFSITRRMKVGPGRKDEGMNILMNTFTLTWMYTRTKIGKYKDGGRRVICNPMKHVYLQSKNNNQNDVRRKVEALTVN
jgi:hypothetical protein